MASKKQSIAKQRYLARRMVVQALYQRDLSGAGINDLLLQFRQVQLGEADATADSSHAHPEADQGYFQRLLGGAIEHENALIGHVEPLLNRGWGACDSVERAIMLMAAFEMGHCFEIPYKVVINEAVEQAKDMGADQSHKFINGVLDKLAKQLRAVEVGGKK